MAVSTDRPVEVFRVHPAALWVAALSSLVLQSFLPLQLPLARLMDFPLLITIYFALVRRNKVFGMGLGTGLGLLQDALTHGYIGIFGIAKTLVGYLAASASVRFELESILARSVMTGVFVLIHSLCRAGLQHALLEFPPSFHPLDVAATILVNVALGLVLFLLLDRFKHPE
jgi:rod shape-determining protein MreD